MFVVEGFSQGFFRDVPPAERQLVDCIHLDSDGMRVIVGRERQAWNADAACGDHRPESAT